MTGFPFRAGNVPNIIPNYTPAGDGNNDQYLLVAGKRVHKDIENMVGNSKKRELQFDMYCIVDGECMNSNFKVVIPQ